MNTLRKWINTYTKRKQEEGFWTKKLWVTRKQNKIQITNLRGRSKRWGHLHIDWKFSNRKAAKSQRKGCKSLRSCTNLCDPCKVSWNLGWKPTSVWGIYVLVWEVPKEALEDLEELAGSSTVVASPLLFYHFTAACYFSLKILICLGSITSSIIFFFKYQYPGTELYSSLIFFPKSLSTINKPWWQLPFLGKFTKLKLTHGRVHAHTRKHTHIWFFETGSLCSTGRYRSRVA